MLSAFEMQFVSGSVCQVALELISHKGQDPPRPAGAQNMLPPPGRRQPLSSLGCRWQTQNCGAFSLLAAALSLSLEVREQAQGGSVQPWTVEGPNWHPVHQQRIHFSPWTWLLKISQRGSCVFFFLTFADWEVCKPGLGSR